VGAFLHKPTIINNRGDSGAGNLNGSIVKRQVHNAGFQFLSVDLMDTT
jgi:hypothetical protein